MNDTDMLDDDPFMSEEFDTSPYDGYGQSGRSSFGESQFTLNIENAAIRAGLSQSPDMSSFRGDNYHDNVGIMTDNQGISCPVEYPRFMSQGGLCVAPGQLMSSKGTSSLGVSADPPVYPDLPVACDAPNSHYAGTTITSPQSPSSSLQPKRRKEKPGNRPCDVK
ncbi:hypothetical protein BKA56DRAFT_625629 [Ilyonectria sp. MPI-CAGE-AT-0026]|nr:hypothetical protein BKA56DRAFT_625629 [Ilyonectria sp. MPI-CAGE-AT-0026]